MATTAGTKKATAKSETEIIETSSEVLADGPVELVAPNGSRPQLLFWPDKRRPIVASEIAHDGRRFIPVNLHPTFWARTKLPDGSGRARSGFPIARGNQSGVARFCGLDRGCSAADCVLGRYHMVFRCCVHSADPPSVRNPGMYIVFDENVIRCTHESARKHGIGEAVAGCSHCVATGLGNSPTMSGLDAM